MIKQFVVCGITYNGAQASAVEQDHLLSLLAPVIMDRAMGAAAAGLELGVDVLMPMFMAMPVDMKAKVSKILFSSVCEHGGSQVLTVEDFGGRMVAYNTLLSELLKWNLDDFFSWLQSVHGADKAAEKAAMNSHSVPV